MTRLLTNLSFKIHFKKRLCTHKQQFTFQTEKNYIRNKKPIQVIILIFRLANLTLANTTSPCEYFPDYLNVGPFRNATITYLSHSVMRVLKTFVTYKSQCS